MERLKIEKTSLKATKLVLNQKDWYTVDFGAIPFKSECSVDLLLEDENLSDVSVKVTCGCTSQTNESLSKNSHRVGFVYKNTNISGEFEKTVFVNYNSKKNKNKIRLTLKGKVLRNG